MSEADTNTTYTVRLVCASVHSNRMTVTASSPAAAARLALEIDDNEYDDGEMGPSYVASVESAAGDHPIPADLAEPSDPMLDTRELATVLAALGYWQRHQARQMHTSTHRIPEDDVVTLGGTVVPLSFEEIEELCVRLNTAPAPGARGEVRILTAPLYLFEEPALAALAAAARSCMGGASNDDVALQNVVVTVEAELAQRKQPMVRS